MSKNFYGSLYDGRTWGDPILSNKERGMLDQISSLNKELYVVSNQDVLGRRQFADRVNGQLEHKVNLNKIYTSAYVAGRYIQNNYPKVSKVRFVGNE
jgi:ribonucleotide monophosphatase NagD (HAD superfamily)